MRYALLLLTALSFAGCSLIDPAEEIPSYVSIHSVSFTAASNQGTSSHAITDAWIYIDGELMGAYEIPCKVPVLKEGTHTVLVLAGIKQNGLSSMRAIYPYYKGWESTVELTRGQITVLAPAFTYYPGVEPVWNSEFSGSWSNFNGTGHAPFPAAYAVVTGPDAFEGSAARIQLNETENSYYGTSSDSFLLDLSKEIYLECNYRCDQPFVIGLRNCDPGQGYTISWLEVAASATWNKLYVRLNDALEGQPASAHYSISFAAVKPSESATGTIWLDNLKLIY